MELIALMCPRCSGEVKLDKDREFGFCQYCGTKIMVASAQRVSGTVNVSRQPEVENLLGRALQYEEDGDLDQAETYFNRVLDIDMNDRRAQEGYERVRSTIAEPNVFISNGQTKKNALLTIKEGSERVCALRCGQGDEIILPAGRHTLSVYWGKKQLDSIKLRIGTRYEKVYITCSGGEIDIKHTGRAKRRERAAQEPEGQKPRKLQNTQGYEPRKKGRKKKKSCLRVALGIPLAVIGLVIFMSALFGEDSGESPSPEANITPTAEPTNGPEISLAEFNAIEIGMTYDEIVEIIGGEGELGSEVDLGMGEEYRTLTYTWDGAGSLGANAIIQIQNGKVATKSQFGLE